MSKTTDNAIRSALKQYERDLAQTDKKAVLLTPQGGFFLYGNRFCGIEEYELDLSSESLQIQGQTVQRPLLFRVFQDGLHVTGERAYAPTLVSLIFHIRLGDEGLLRGILHALGEEVQLSLFCEESTEKLYRLSRKSGTLLGQGPPPDEILLHYAETLRRNDLHWLADLYLQGRQLKQLFDTDFLSG